MNFEAWLLITSFRTLFGLDNVVFDNISHFILIADLSLSLIRRLGYGFRLSLLDIIVGLSGGGIDVVGWGGTDVVGYFWLYGRFSQNVIAHSFAGSLLFLQVSIFLLSRLADICSWSTFYVKRIWVWSLICSFKLGFLLYSFTFRHVFNYLFSNSLALLLW